MTFNQLYSEFWLPPDQLLTIQSCNCGTFFASQILSMIFCCQSGARRDLFRPCSYENLMSDGNWSLELDHVQEAVVGGWGGWFHFPDPEQIQRLIVPAFNLTVCFQLTQTAGNGPARTPVSRG